MKLKEKLRKNKLSIGSWLSLSHPSIAEILARSGFEWLTIDMEHSVISLKESQNLIGIIESSGIAPLVRVPENSHSFIKRVMDAGAHGIIVPMVNSKEEAIKVVKAVKYPPMGTRGVGLARAQGYGFNFENYSKRINKDSIVIVQIEHIDAINNLEEILNVQGVDASMLGPYDLSASLGYPGDFKRKEFKLAIKKYIQTCKKMGKVAGYHVVHPDPQLVRVKILEGFRFIAVGFDALYLGLIARNTLSEITKLKKD